MVWGPLARRLVGGQSAARFQGAWGCLLAPQGGDGTGGLLVGGTFVSVVASPSSPMALGTAARLCWGHRGDDAVGRGAHGELGWSPGAGGPHAQPGYASISSGSWLSCPGHGHVPLCFAPGGHPGCHPPFPWEGHGTEPGGVGRLVQDQGWVLFYSRLGIHITSLTWWLQTRI